MLLPPDQKFQHLPHSIPPFRSSKLNPTKLFTLSDSDSQDGAQNLSSDQAVERSRLKNNQSSAKSKFTHGHNLIDRLLEKGMMEKIFARVIAGGPLRGPLAAPSQGAPSGPPGWRICKNFLAVSDIIYCNSKA